jgi:hypothetical protein
MIQTNRLKAELQTRLSATATRFEGAEERSQVSVEMLETLQKWMAELVTGGAK